MCHMGETQISEVWVDRLAIRSSTLCYLPPLPRSSASSGGLAGKFEDVTRGMSVRLPLCHTSLHRVAETFTVCRLSASSSRWRIPDKDVVWVLQFHETTLQWKRRCMRTHEYLCSAHAPRTSSYARASDLRDARNQGARPASHAACTP